MPYVYIQIVSSLHNVIPIRPSQDPFVFSVPASHAIVVGAPALQPGTGIEVQIAAEGDRATATGRFDISLELRAALAAYEGVYRLVDTLQREYKSAVEVLAEAVHRLVDLLAQEIRGYSVSAYDPHIARDLWSEDGVSWQSVAERTTQVTLTAALKVSLDRELAAGVQRLASSGARALVATHFLHRAHNEEDPRMRWISAALAAELAVKEVLVRHNRERGLALIGGHRRGIISALSGEGLRELAGAPSPFLKELVAGANKRNDLVHEPEIVQVTSDEAFEYLLMVDQAIRHLLGTLRPAVRTIIRQKARAHLTVVVPDPKASLPDVSPAGADRAPPGIG